MRRIIESSHLDLCCFQKPIIIAYAVKELTLLLYCIQYRRSHGGQKKRYKNTLKASLKDFNIPTESWEQIAQDRTKWRGLIKRGGGGGGGAGEYEAKRISEAEQKRAHTNRAFFLRPLLFYLQQAV